MYRKATEVVSRHRHYLIILAVYFVGFLLITPIGKFNPGVPDARSFSLMKIDPWDDTAYYMIAKSIIVDGDLDYSNEQLADRAFYSVNSLGNTRQGTSVPIGPSILWAPFILAAQVLTVLFNVFSGEGLVANGYSPLYLLVTCVGSSLYAFLSLLISYKILKKFFSPNISLLSVLTVFIGNTLIYNTYIRMLMSHAPEVFTIALFIFFFLRIVEKGELTDSLFLGIGGGLLVIVRYDNAIFLIMPIAHILSLCWQSVKSGQWYPFKELLRKYTVSVLVSFVVILPQFLHYYIQSGVIIPETLGGHLSRTFDTMVGIKALFFSETRNILWGKPIVIIGAIGSFLFIRQNRFLGVTLSLIIMVGMLWLFWRPHVYWWGMDFGIRHLIKLSLPLAFGYAALIQSVNIKGKTVCFSVLSLLIVLWEYFKIIQVPYITPVLKDDFLTACALKIPDLITNSPLNVLTGTECSYLRVLTTYGLNLTSFNLTDLLFLIVLPLSIFALCLFVVLLFTYGDKGLFSRRSPSICATGIVIFFGALSIAGLAYPKKPPIKIYDDFKRAALLAYDAGHYGLSSRYINKALSIKPDGDELIKKLIAFMNKDYYDLGTAGTRSLLKRGWSIDEGHMADAEGPTFVWAVGTDALIVFEIKPNKSFNTLIFKCRPYPPDQRVTIMLNGKYVGHINPVPGWQEYHVRVEPGQLRPGKNHLRFRFKYAESPAETGGKDRRKLAVAFDWLKLEDNDAMEK